MKAISLLEHATVVAFMVASLAPTSFAGSVKHVRMIPPEKAGPVVENIGKVFARQVEQRCEAKVGTEGEREYVYHTAQIVCFCL